MDVQLAFSVYNAIEYALAVGQDDDLVRKQLQSAMDLLRPSAMQHPEWEIE